MSRNYHFIGIGGIGMSSLAHMCLDRGDQVSGSDMNMGKSVASLIKRGAKVSTQDQDFLKEKEVAIVYSSAIKESHIGIQEAKKKNLPLLHRSELLALFAKEKKTLLVSGSHGKTTTTALLAHVLQTAQEKPSYMIGGHLPKEQPHGAFEKGKWMVIEADESDGSFLRYPAYGAIVTNIEPEHMDFYKDVSMLREYFVQFMQKVGNQRLVWCKDDPFLNEMLPEGISYGEHPDSQVCLKSFIQEEEGIRFSIQLGKTLYQDFFLPLLGKHNALNALSVFALCQSLDIPTSTIQKAFSSFSGVARRSECKGRIGGVTVYDDYAHHPTEIRASLNALRDAVKEKKIISVFQPHRVSRWEECKKEFFSSFSSADLLVVTDIYKAGEQKEAKKSIKEELENFAKRSLVETLYVPREELESSLLELVRPHDVVVTLGAGDITELSSSLVSKLKRNSPKPWKIGLVYGGGSTEHYVSKESAHTLLKELSHSSIYDTNAFYIDSEGNWETGTCKEESLLSEKVLQELLECEIFFPVMHGFWGEDGGAQGLFAALKKPFVGSSHRVSAICMHKAASKLLAKKGGVPIGDFSLLTQSEWFEKRKESLEKIKDQMHFPFFVKPCNMGSSVGVCRVCDSSSLENALDQVFLYDKEALIEEEILGRQIEFLVLGNDLVYALPPGEIITKTGELVGYKDKYGSQALPMEGRAKLAESIIEEGKNLACKVYSLLGAQGFARVDFFLNEQGFFFSEINSLPGLTPTSMVPCICKENDLSISCLIDRLIVSSLHAHRMDKKKCYTLGKSGVIV